MNAWVWRQWQWFLAILQLPRRHRISVDLTQVFQWISRNLNGLDSRTHTCMPDIYEDLRNLDFMVIIHTSDQCYVSCVHWHNSDEGIGKYIENSHGELEIPWSQGTKNGSDILTKSGQRFCFLVSVVIKVAWPYMCERFVSVNVVIRLL